MEDDLVEINKKIAIKNSELTNFKLNSQNYKLSKLNNLYQKYILLLIISIFNQNSLKFHN